LGAGGQLRRKEHGYNGVATTKGHPVLTFLRKFCEISARMLELIIVLSTVLGKHSDLIVASALLVIPPVLSVLQECRAPGVAVEPTRQHVSLPERGENAGIAHLVQNLAGA